MSLAAKGEEWKSHGEEGKRTAEEEDGKEKPKGNTARKPLEPESLSPC